MSDELRCENKKEPVKSQGKQEIKDDVHKWLAGHFETDIGYINSVMKDERATYFLIIWSIFERKCFDGFMKKSQIETFVEKNLTLLNPEKIGIKKSIEHFHNRYRQTHDKYHLQNEERYKVLKHDCDFKPSNEAVCCKYEDLNDKQKLNFVIYVIYRFRNNIFHGNKEFLSWIKYPDEMKCCIDTMTKIIDIVPKIADAKPPIPCIMNC